MNECLNLDFTESFGYQCVVVLYPYRKGIRWENIVGNEIETQSPLRELGINISLNISPVYKITNFYL